MTTAREKSVKAEPAILVLEDGRVFGGTSVGASGQTVGEVVFNTAMTGYQEILSDPSYAKQMVTLTYPHIGNTGTTPDDDESARCFATGLIVRDVPKRPSNWRNQQSLNGYLTERGVVAIADIDTRSLTRHLRTHGALGGCILTGVDGDDADAVARALGEARSFPGLAGMDLAKEVSCRQPYEWTTGSWSLDDGIPAATAAADLKYHVVALDFGIKTNILRMLVDQGCRVTVVPATTTSDTILSMAPDGVFLSNGPGDPEPCDYAIECIRDLLAKGLPMFGICLGHQLLALASGAKTQKMKFGHHGANHPVKNLNSGRVMISSQNHGFAVDPDSLGNHLVATHESLFDHSLQGIKHTAAPAYGFQGHPEASPGPHDVAMLFAEFTQSIAQHGKQRAAPR